MANEAKPRTLVTKGTTFRGSIETSDEVAIEGRLEGDIRAPLLEVASGAVVHGKIDVDTLKSAGELTGEIHVHRAVLSGKVGDGTTLRADTLEAPLPGQPSGSPGLVLGNCTLEVGGDPAATSSPSGSRNRQAVH